MMDAERLFEENAALIALLTTIDRKRDSWSSIANNVEREGSAIRLLMHDMDPTANKLYGNEDPDDYEAGDLTLFDDEPDPARLAELEQARQSARVRLRTWSDGGLDFISVLDPRYPNRLRQVVDMPPFLFAEGALRQDELGVSVVGSRRASEDALAFARETASMLVHDNLTVIAGLAAGVDTAAHRQTLDEGGRTVAFIGTGITRQYPPANRDLQREIGERGLILSQFWPEQGPTKYTFPMRNASMSGYGVATVVVQAGEHSGTRIQARQAQQHGRPVILRDQVVNTTQWGHDLVSKPGVYVVSTVDDVRNAIDDILGMSHRMQAALDQLIDSYRVA